MGNLKLALENTRSRLWSVENMDKPEELSETAMALQKAAQLKKDAELIEELQIKLQNATESSERHEATLKFQQEQMRKAAKEKAALETDIVNMKFCQSSLDQELNMLKDVVKSKDLEIEEMKAMLESLKPSKSEMSLGSMGSPSPTKAGEVMSEFVSNDLQEQIWKAEEKLEKKEMIVGDLENKLETIGATLETKEAEILEMKKEVTQVSVEKKELLEQVEMLKVDHKTQIQQLEQEKTTVILTQNNQFLELEQEFDKVTKMKETLQNELLELEKKMAQRIELKDAETAALIQEKEVAAASHLEEQIKKLNSEHLELATRKEQQIKGLEDQLESISRGMKDKDQAISELQSVLTQAQTQNQELSASVANLTATVTEKNAVLEENLKAMFETNEKISAVEEALSEMKAKNEVDEAKKAELEAQLGETLASLNNAQGELAAKESKFAAEVESLRQENSNLHSSNQEIQSKLEETVTSLNEQLQSSAKILELKESKISELMDSLASLEKDKVGQSLSLERLEAELEKKSMENKKDIDAKSSLISDLQLAKDQALSDNAILSQKLSAETEKLSQLESVNDNLKSKVETSEVKANELSKQIEGLEGSLQEKEDMLEKAIMEQMTCQGDNEEAIKAKAQELQKMSQTLHQLRETNEDLSGQLSQLKTEHSGQIEAALKTTTLTESENRELKSRAEDLEAEKAAMTEAISRKEKQAEEKIQELQNRNLQQKEEIEALTQSVEELKNQQARETGIKSEIEEELVQVKKTCSDLVASMDETNTKLAAKEAEISHLQEESNKLQDEGRILAETLKESKSQLETKERNEIERDEARRAETELLASKESEIESLRSESTNLARDKHLLSSQIVELQNLLDSKKVAETETEKSLQNCKAELALQETALCNLNSELKQLQDKLDVVSQESNDFKTRLDMKMKDEVQGKEEFVKMERANELLEATISSVREENNALKASLEQSETKTQELIEDTNTKVAAIRSELAKSAAEIETARRENEELKSTLEELKNRKVQEADVKNAKALESLRKEKEELESKLKESTETISRHDEKMAAKKASYQQKLRDAAEAIQGKYQAKILECQQNYQKDLESKEEVCRALKSESEMALETVQSLKERLAKSESTSKADLAKLQKKYDACKVLIANLTKELEDLKKTSKKEIATSATPTTTSTTTRLHKTTSAVTVSSATTSTTSSSAKKTSSDVCFKAPMNTPGRTKPGRTKSDLNVGSSSGRAPPKGSGNLFRMDDEAGEMFSSSYLSDMKSGTIYILQYSTA